LTLVVSNMARGGGLIRFALGYRREAPGLLGASSTSSSGDLSFLHAKFHDHHDPLPQRRGLCTPTSDDDQGKAAKAETKANAKGEGQKKKKGADGGYLHGRQYEGKEAPGGGAADEKGRERRRRFVPMASRGRGKDALGGSFASRILGGRGDGGDGKPRGGRPRSGGGNQRDSGASQAGGNGPRGHDRTIYVKGLNYGMTEEEVRKGLTELFGESCGRVQQVRIPMDREQGRHKGYCFVKFQDPKAKAKALEDMDGTEFGERWLTIDDGDSRGRSAATGRQGMAARGARSRADDPSAAAAAVAGLPDDDGPDRMRARRARRGREGQQHRPQYQQQRRDGQPRGLNIRSGQVKRSNRSRRQGRGDYAFVAQRVDLEQEAATAERERIEDLDRMLEVLAAKGSAEGSDYESLTEYERHEREMNLVVDLLSAFHPNLAVGPVDMAGLLAGGEGDVDGAGKRGFLDFEEEWKGLLEVGDEEWKLISEGAEEDVSKATKKLERQGWLRAQDPGREEAARELEEMTNLVSSDDPLKDHMAKAMAVLQSSAGWDHGNRKKYMRDLIEMT